jgi:hypothetical protein
MGFYRKKIGSDEKSLNRFYPISVFRVLFTPHFRFYLVDSKTAGIKWGQSSDGTGDFPVRFQPYRELALRKVSSSCLRRLVLCCVPSPRPPRFERRGGGMGQSFQRGAPEETVTTGVAKRVSIPRDPCCSGRAVLVHR